MCSNLCLFLVIVFLKEQIGTRHIWGLLRHDRWDGVAILRAQAALHIEDLACLTHGLANITEGVGKVFQAAGVLSNVHVPLDKIVKLSFKVHCAMEFIAMEPGMDAGPDEVRGGLRNMHDGKHVLRNRVVELAQDALVTEAPVHVTALRPSGWGRRGGIQDQISL